jgi:starch synthase (maltosyl-transferring)
VSGLKQAGLDYLFNSSKYWNFDQDWALEQHAQFGAIAPSVSFPESHDTPRLMAETDGNLSVQRQRYLLAVVFSEAVMMPIGYEFGFLGKLDVVKTRPDHWEQTGVDCSGFIAAANALKTELAPLGCEGTLRALTPYDQPTLILEKSTDDSRVHVLINKDWHQAQRLDLTGLEAPAGRLLRLEPDGERREEPLPLWTMLDPAEIALVA